MTLIASATPISPIEPTVPPHRVLRMETGRAHEAVDAAFGGLGVDSAQRYRRFLLAHARVLPGWERALLAAGLLEPDRAREPLLRADLAALATEMPTLVAATATTAELWGALYVLEGSRLGGAMLARAVPATLPAAYLGAKHRPGEWRDTLARLDAALDGSVIDVAVAGARRVFADYLAAATDGHVDG